MKLFSLLLGVALLAACCVAVEDQHDNEQPPPNTSSTTAMTELKPTIEPPTKAATVAEVSPTERTSIENVIKAEALLIELPDIVNQSNFLTVSGFITKNGDIYKIENQNVIGEMQSRQVQHDRQHICNYGPVVIYSDVPCQQVTSGRATEVDESPAPAIQEPNMPAEGNKEKLNKNDSEDVTKIFHKRPNKNGQSRPNKNGQKRPNQSTHKNPNQNAQKRPNKNGQKRPNQNGQKRPNQNGQKVPKPNVQKRPNQQDQKYSINEEYDIYGDELYLQELRRHILAQRYISNYNGYEY